MEEMELREGESEGGAKRMLSEALQRNDAAAAAAAGGANSASAEFLRPFLDRTVSDDSQDCEGESPGLDALAMAARMSG